jgi:hypothetical protein
MCNCHSLSLQIDALHGMYEKLVELVDKDSLESRRKTKLSLPRMAMLQGEPAEANSS